MGSCCSHQGDDHNENAHSRIKSEALSVGTLSSDHSHMHPLSAGDVDVDDVDESSWSRASRHEDSAAARIGLEKARASVQLVSARLQEVRMSWQARPAHTESFEAEGSHCILNRARAEEAFENVVVEAVLKQIMALRRRRGGGLEAAFLVVGLSESLNDAFAALVGGKDAKLLQQFDAFAPHSPLCMCYYVMDAAIAVVESFMADDEARAPVEKGSGALKKAAQARLREQLRGFLREFVRDNEYDPFGHVCEDASMHELREHLASGELQPLFVIGDSA